MPGPPDAAKRAKTFSGPGQILVPDQDGRIDTDGAGHSGLVSRPGGRRMLAQPTCLGNRGEEGGGT